MPYAGVNGQRLYYEVGGDGESVIILHGQLADADIMEAPATGIATGLRAIRIDRRGHGRSGLAGAPVSLSDEAADLAALLDWFGAEKTHLLAHDDGAGVAVEFTLTHPERVLSLGLLAPTIEGVPESLEAEVKRLELVGALHTDARKAIEEKWLASPLFDVVKERDGMFDRVAAIVRRSAESAQLLEHAPAATPTQLERLPAISTRCIILVGDRDELDHLRAAEAIADAIPGSDLATFPGLGHFLHVEDSRAIMRRLTDFYMPEPEFER
jgi:3-oxoadipate enol-lactonase